MASRVSDHWALMLHRLVEGAEHPEPSLSFQARRKLNAQVAALRSAEKHRAWAESEPEPKSPTAKAVLRWSYRLSGIMYEKMAKAQAAVSQMHPEIAQEINEAVEKAKADASLLVAYGAPARKKSDARVALIRHFKTLHAKLTDENLHELARSLRTLLATYEQTTNHENLPTGSKDAPPGEGGFRLCSEKSSNVTWSNSAGSPTIQKQEKCGQQ